MNQLVKLGASEVAKPTGVPVAHVQLDIGGGESSDYGVVPMLQALGVTAIPAAASDNGDAAEGILVEEIGGLNGAVIGARDARSADVAEGLGPGGTALHSTEEDPSTRAQVRCLPNILAFLIGNDTPITINREKKEAVLNLWGHQIQIDADSITFTEKDGAYIELKGGKMVFNASAITAAGGMSSGAVGIPVALATPLLTYLQAQNAAIAAAFTAVGAGPVALGAAGAGAYQAAMAAPTAAMIAAMPAKTTTGS